MSRRQILLALLIGGVSFATGNYLGGARAVAPVVIEGGGKVVSFIHDRVHAHATIEAVPIPVVDSAPAVSSAPAVPGTLRVVVPPAAFARRRATLDDVRRDWGITGDLDCSAYTPGSNPRSFDDRMGTTLR